MSVLKNIWLYLLLLLTILTIPINHADKQPTPITPNTNLSLHQPETDHLSVPWSQFQNGGLVQVAEHVPLNLVINYQTESSRSQTIQSPGAAFIKVHFQRLNLLPGDYVTISDPGGVEHYSYPNQSDFTTGSESEGFWAISITGDTAVIRLHTTTPNLHPPSRPESYGIHIDQYARGYSANEVAMLNETAVPTSTCGSPERYDAICYATTHPTEYAKSNAVARLLLTNSSGSYVCTAWRAGSQNRMITNEHCISSQADVEATELWFDYQRLTCGGATNPTITKVTGDTFLTADFTHDVAVFTVNDFAAVEQFGYLEFEFRPPIWGEEIYVPQHGLGNPREFGIESDMNSGGVCRIDDAVRDGRGAATDTGYFCDTIGGSSGSPVLARSSHKVLALHHFGTGATFCDSTTMNGGARMDQIWPLISPYFAALPVEDIYEPDNVPQDATVIVDGAAQMHSIVPAGDVDWVTFSLAGETAVTLQISDASGIHMRLVNSTLNELEHSSGTVASPPHIDRVCGVDALPPGQYFVQIDTPNNTETAEYTIRYTIDDHCSNTQAALTAAGYTVDDDHNAQSRGNSDHHLNAGEQVELYFVVANIGAQTAVNVFGCISTESDYVIGPHYNSCSIFGSVAGGSSAANTDDFDFSIAPGTLDEHTITFTLHLTHSLNSDTWLINYVVPVQGNQVIYLPLVIMIPIGR